MIAHHISNDEMMKGLAELASSYGVTLEYFLKSLEEPDVYPVGEKIH